MSSPTEEMRDKTNPLTIRPPHESLFYLEVKFW